MEDKNSELYKEKQNAKLFSLIAIAGFVVLHVLAFTLSATPMANMKAYPLLWILPVLAIIALGLTIKGVTAGSEVAETQRWPYILLIVLSFASAVAVGYCATC